MSHDDDESRDPEDTKPVQPPPADLETDDRFPTGPWEGFFLQPQLYGRETRHWMELNLTFRHGSMTGEGRDRVGNFIVKGGYSTEDGKAWWSKRYVGKHDVFYQGYNESKGIWGTWELKVPPWRGGFHIWPLGMGDPTKQRISEEADIPVEEEVGVLVGAGVGGEDEDYEQGLGI